CSARSPSTTFAPTTSTFASLFPRAISVCQTVGHETARIPASLLQAIVSPEPPPPTTSAKSARPASTSRQTASQSGGRRPPPAPPTPERARSTPRPLRRTQPPPFFFSPIPLWSAEAATRTILAGYRGHWYNGSSVRPARP